MLTALLAEQAVESIEWHHKVNAAVADMDNELGTGDGPQAYARLADARLHCHAAGRDPRCHREWRPGAERQTDRHLLAAEADLGLAGARSGNASDVASHMPHQRMLEYRIAYEVVPDMQRLADKELADLGHLRALPRSGGAIETAEKLHEIDAIEALRLDNDAIAREARFTLCSPENNKPQRSMRAFVRRDMLEARTNLGNCLSTPVSAVHCSESLTGCISHS